MRITSLALILATLFLFACKGKKDVAQKHTHNYGAKFNMHIGDSATFDDGLVFRLKRVTSDSRCPKGSNCVWAGEVIAVFSANEEEELTISSDPLKNPVQLGAYQIELFQVEPVKEDKEIAQKDYQLFFNITKLEKSDKP